MLQFPTNQCLSDFRDGVLISSCKAVAFLHLYLLDPLPALRGFRSFSNKGVWEQWCRQDEDSRTPLTEAGMWESLSRQGPRSLSSVTKWPLHQKQHSWSELWSGDHPSMLFHRLSYLYTTLIHFIIGSCGTQWRSPVPLWLVRKWTPKSGRVGGPYR